MPPQCGFVPGSCTINERSMCKSRAISDDQRVNNRTVVREDPEKIQLESPLLFIGFQDTSYVNLME